MERGVKELPATCPPPPYLRNLDASLKEAAAPATCAARWKKLLAAWWTTETSVTTKPLSGSSTSMSPRSKDALPVPGQGRHLCQGTGDLLRGRNRQRALRQWRRTRLDGVGAMPGPGKEGLGASPLRLWQRLLGEWSFCQWSGTCGALSGKAGGRDWQATLCAW
jgi:hypothetical protein